MPQIYIKCSGLTAEEMNILLKTVEQIRKIIKRRNEKLSYIVDTRDDNFKFNIPF